MEPLWTPSDDRVAYANMTDFRLWVERRTGTILSDYAELHRFSCKDVARFWQLFMDYTGVIQRSPHTSVLDDPRMPGAKWFDGMTLNFAENILERGHSGTAIVGKIEPDPESENLASGLTGSIRFDELRTLVARCARGLRDAGIGEGDRVAGFIANVPEAVVAALACASIGATWASASPDFGLEAVVDRFGQVEPRLVFASTHYVYKGQTYHTERTVNALKSRIPSVERIVAVPYPVGTPETEFDSSWNDFLGPDDEPEPEYAALPFDHPLYIMFSSGTTGAPKCLVHGTGGTLLTHRKEHQLHCDLNPGDHLLYFTTCGWMMWNWQLSALSVGATIVCYDGNPAYPDLTTIWKALDDLEVTHFGTSGRHVEACMKGGLGPAYFNGLWGLPYLKSILYTGSPLSETGYQWIYDSVKPDVHLAGIAGGTDILSCFVLGNPTLPVYPGEIQCRGLGVDVVALDEDGKPVIGEPGELVCRQPLPSMPIAFLNDPDGSRYRGAYFEHYPGLWRHGDFVTITERGGAVMHGRSDATLNPGGVRIGSAELYAVLDEIDFVRGSVAVGYTPPGQSDEVVILLVALAPGEPLSEERTSILKDAVRSGCSPRHVPKHIFQISEVPVTRSGKTVELSVKAILQGREVKNRSALANPESLDEIAAIRGSLLAAYPSSS